MEITGRDGRYLINQLPSGDDYVVRFYLGDAVVERPGVRIVQNKTLSISVAMPLKQMTKEVKVIRERAPNVDTATFNAFLKILREELKPEEHAVLIMDQAGWHKSKTLELPENITILLLPSYSPELNPTENLWHYLRSHYLSNRAYDDYDHLFDAGTDAWRALTPEILKSVCACPYIERALQS